ncbi:MAG: aminoglycoside phosphotransferase family protein [Saprospiraceae bacterium]|nr:aminoglycoside phosphotransferase family protein [Saprospiraceae bacterium]
MNRLFQKFLAYERWIGAEPVGSGNINDTYRVEVERGGGQERYLLQRLNHQVFKNPEAVARNIRQVATWLDRQKEYPYRIARPVAGLDGADLQRDEAGNYWRVFTFLDQCYTPETAAGPGEAFEAARAYGQFLYALRDFPVGQLSDTIPGFHDTDLRWMAFEKTLTEDPAGRVSDVQDEIARLYAAKPVFEKISRLKRQHDLPLRVTHNDTKAGNILLDNNTREVVAVIDWDTIMPGTVLSDFGDMVRTFAPDAYEDAVPDQLGLRENVLAALHQGFEHVTRGFLTTTEVEYLPLGARWIVGEQALRFLTDYLAGDVYYKIRHPEHNLIRAQNQLRLLDLVSIFYEKYRR